jgi:hypothetical protein
MRISVEANELKARFVGNTLEVVLKANSVIRSLVGGSALSFALVLTGTSPGGAAPSLPDIVRRASSAYAQSVAGMIGMQRHFKTVINGGPMHHIEESDSAVVLNDGAFVDAAYYRIVDDGRQLSRSDVEKRTAQTVGDWRAGKIFFKEPYDPRYLSDYDFQLLPNCDGCPPNAVAVHFESSLRDTQHGAGTMSIDTHTGRVLTLKYVPNALPPHATSGEVIETSSEPVDGLWYVTRIDQKYQGRYAIFHGSGTFSGTFDHFRRFKNGTAAEAALRDGF